MTKKVIASGGVNVGPDWRWLVGLGGMVILLIFSITISIGAYVFVGLAGRVDRIEEKQTPDIERIERMVILEQKVEALRLDIASLSAKIDTQARLR